MSLRYVELWLSLAKFSLLGELAFRGNFLVKIFVEMLWLGILLLFYSRSSTRRAPSRAGTVHEYLFFVGCYFAMGG